MLRRVSFSAALAALALPVLLCGPAGADPGADPGDGPGDDPVSHAEQRKAQPRQDGRRVELSRRAKRAKQVESDAPLTVTIDQLSPSTMPERGVVRISGTVTNTDTAPWSTINVRPFISAAPLTSAAELEEAAKTPDDVVVGDRINDEVHKDFIEELAPGQSAPYNFSIPRRLLGAEAPGVYWFGVHALGEGPEGRDDNADGRARTFLPLVPQARGGQQPTAVVIPLRHQLVYADDGSLEDLAGWTKTLSPGGRLRSLVDFGASSGDRTVSWVVDPGLVDAVRRLAAGNSPRSLEPNLRVGQDDGEDETDPSAPPGEDTGEGTGDETDEDSGEGSGDDSGDDSGDEPSEEPSEPEATAGSPLDLDQLDPMVQAAGRAAQAWLDRLGAAMRSEDEVMTLPYGDVDVAAAARHDPQLLQRAATRSASGGLAGFDVATTPVVASPSGYLDADGLRLVPEGSEVLLTDAMFSPPKPSVASLDGRRVVVTSTGAADGGPGPGDRTGVTSMRQRLLAEAAVRFLDDERTPLTMMVPHDWNPADGGGTFFGGLDVDWLDLTSVDRVAASSPAEPVPSTSLRYPSWQEGAELDAPSFEAADALIRSGAALQNLLSLNNLVSGTVTDQALGTTSYSARTRPSTNRTSADRSRQWIDDRLGQVLVSAPRAVTLSSSSGQFNATITNQLDQPVTVSLQAESDDQLQISSPRRVEVPANKQFTVLLTARTDENGIHEVTLLVTDKRGAPLGASTRISVRSAQLSNVIWLFIGIGAALLFGAIAVRLFRRVRAARRTPPDPGPDPGPDAGPDGAPTVSGEADKHTAGAGTR
jgi:uncharacterized protein DUF6049